MTTYEIHENPETCCGSLNFEAFAPLDLLGATRLQTLTSAYIRCVACQCVYAVAILSVYGSVCNLDL